MTPASSACDLQLLILSEAEERVMFGLNMALTAAVADVRVIVFFGLDSTRWVCARHTDHDRVSDLLQRLLDQGVAVHCCSSCVLDQCGNARQGEHLRAGVRPAGLAAVVQRATRATQTVTI